MRELDCHPEIALVLVEVDAKGFEASVRRGELQVRALLLRAEHLERDRIVVKGFGPVGCGGAESQAIVEILWQSILLVAPL